MARLLAGNKKGNSCDAALVGVPRSHMRMREPGWLAGNELPHGRAQLPESTRCSADAGNHATTPPRVESGGKLKPLPVC